MVEKIRELCKINGISISKLEKEIGLGNGTIGKWEKFDRKPKYEHLKAIADTLGTTVAELTGEEQKEKLPAQGREAIGPNKRALLDLVGTMSEDEAGPLLEVVQASLKMRGKK